MSLIPKCTVCDSPVANPYAPSATCDRCSQPCPECGGWVGFCKHDLPEQLTEVEHGIAPDNGRVRVAA